MSLRPTNHGNVSLLPLLLFLPWGGCGGNEGPSSIERAMMAPEAKAPGKTSAEKDAKAGAKKPKAPEQTPEERRAALKALGIRPKDEIAAENAAMFEKGAREYIKRRLPDYRALVDDLEKELERLEKAAASWPGAKDPAEAFGKFEKKLRPRAEKIRKRYDALTGHGAKGGNTQAVFGKAFRTWERMLEVLDPKIGQNPRFSEMAGEVRQGLAQVRKALDDIEQDESLQAEAGARKGSE